MKDRLNLGSGKDYKVGWLNVDINEKFKPDVVKDIRELSFPENTFKEILAKDVIDHVTFIEAKKLLRKIHKWLKPDGSLIIHTPNLRRLASILSMEDNVEALMFMYGTSGEGSTHYWSNTIRWCYSKEQLVKTLSILGFRVLEVEDTCDGWCFMITAIKEKKK